MLRQSGAPRGVVPRSRPAGSLRTSGWACDAPHAVSGRASERARQTSKCPRKRCFRHLNQVLRREEGQNRPRLDVCVVELLHRVAFLVRPVTPP
eukprot:94543-Rhodomonas_salina.6